MEETETCSFDPSPESEEAVLKNVETKLRALETEDLNLYLTTVTGENEYYYNEQGRWFREMTSPGIRDISLSVLSIELRDEETAVAEIHQHHFSRKHFDFTYPLLFREEKGKWLDAGYDFQVLETDRYSLKYMEGEPRVEEFRQMIDTAYDNLENIFKEKPDPHFEIKLFHDREMLRQRSVPSIGWLFTGWGEPNESLKLYTGHPDIRGYQGTIQHELIHHITIKTCRNNLPAWILEGVAMYYGNARFDPSLSSSLSHIKKEKSALTIDYLESLDLYDASQEEIWNWYNTSYLYTACLIETYGHGKIMDLFYEAGKKPFNNSVLNPNFEKDNRHTMDEVLFTVLELTKEVLSLIYIEWLESAEIPRV